MLIHLYLSSQNYDTLDFQDTSASGDPCSTANLNLAVGSEDRILVGLISNQLISSSELFT